MSDLSESDWRTPNLLKAHISAKKRRLLRLEREVAETREEILVLEAKVADLLEERS